jgi:predicted Ser/Thr protein kinase
MATCPECGSGLKADASEGLCPKCLLAQGIQLVSDLAPPVIDHGDERVLRHFGDYELLEEIAQGGIGVIYRARQRSLNRMVAVKMLLLGPRASTDFVKRFRTEASAAASLQHANIVAIHEVGVFGGEHYLVMDLVDGPNLAQLIKAQPLSSQRAASYLKTVAEAIHYAHERGILHRDLKPSNVLIDENDQPRVTDFGLAKRMDSEAGLTLTGHVLGTPSYVPPEQAGGDSGQVGRHSDVYSLGAMLYHLLAGRPPFVGGTLSETLDQVFHHDPVSLRLLNPTVPRDLETICLKCLEKQPSRRYPTAQALADELGRFLHGESIQARPANPVEQAYRLCQRKPAMAILLVLLILVGAAGLSGILWQAHRSEVQRVQAEQDLYVANVHRADDAIAAHELANAREALRAIEMSPAQRDMRDWAWRYVSGRARSDELRILSRHESWLADLAVAPDGSKCAAISEDGLVTLYDLRLEKQITQWHAHANTIRDQPDWNHHTIVFTPDGSTIITAGEDAAVRFWQLGTNVALVHQSIGLGKPVFRLAISPDGSTLAGQCFSENVYLWRLTPGAAIEPAEIQCPGFALPGGIAFSPDGGKLLIGWGFKPIIQYDLSIPDRPRPLPPLRDTFPFFVFSPDGRWLVSQGPNRQIIRRWSWPSLQALPEILVEGGSVDSLAISADSQQLAAGLMGAGRFVLSHSSWSKRWRGGRLAKDSRSCG